MQIDEQQYYEFIERVVHEGEPELMFVPLGELPANVPATWVDVLTAPDWRKAVGELWCPVYDRLPRMCRALQERLQAVGLLRTEDIPASLIYFFREADDLYEYRGRAPLSATKLAAFHLPKDFVEFSSIHDGWVLYYSKDDGPVPSSEWLPPDSFWEDIQLRMPPGEVSPGDLKTVFRSGDESLFVFDTSKSPALPLVVWRDGTVEPLADMWAAIDREIGEFLEELDPAPEVTLATVPALTLREQETARHCDHVLERVAALQSAGTHWGGAMLHRQAYDSLLERARIEIRSGGQPERARDFYRKALHEWCWYIDRGGDISPDELLEIFGLAHWLGDSVTAHFLATLPAWSWADGSLDAVQVNVLFRLFLGDFDEAVPGMEHLLGITFDDEEPPSEENEIVARLLESLTEKNSRSFADWRQRAASNLCTEANQIKAEIPWHIKLCGFDAVALHLGLTKLRVQPLIKPASRRKC